MRKARRRRHSSVSIFSLSVFQWPCAWRTTHGVLACMPLAPRPRSSHDRDVDEAGTRVSFKNEEFRVASSHSSDIDGQLLHSWCDSVAVPWSMGDDEVHVYAAGCTRSAGSCILLHYTSSSIVTNDAAAAAVAAVARLVIGYDTVEWGRWSRTECSYSRRAHVCSVCPLERWFFGTPRGRAPLSESRRGHVH